ncbi:hypothetical protein L3i20_v244600 [Paenibacillus sp. L3-i20]|nr:hypothetical protein L3i20_v244600 [Paenibacillus sp. L3-i20]
MYSPFRQRINDAYNSKYVSQHNLGVASFQDRTVTNYFYTVAGKEQVYTWNFANRNMWD